MEKEALYIHGSLLVFFKRFIENAYTPGIRNKIFQKEEKSILNIHEKYPLSEMTHLITKSANVIKISEKELKETFGEYLVPDLLNAYTAYIRPDWKTFDLLANTELVMHKAVRREDHNASPPFLKISRVHDSLLFIDYHSERKMASLAFGIVKGIVNYYSETKSIRLTPTISKDDERAYIMVEIIT